MQDLTPENRPLQNSSKSSECLNGLRQSSLSSRTSKEIAQSETSINAQLLTRAGFVDRLMAGVYSYLPLGIRVLQKIENIIREEMTLIGSQEILMPALQPSESWHRTGRWDTMDVLFKLKGSGGRDLALGPTHEEVVTPLIGQFIRSYSDLPMSVFQIQTKFRNEPRAKSGLLRGREFRMKDMYSFHRSQDELDEYYDHAKLAYHRVFQRCGLGDVTFLTFASGGSFSKYSHEFQTLTPNGEDTVYVEKNGRSAVNHEVFNEYINEPHESGESFAVDDFEEKRAIEVGNIFSLGTRFSDAFDLKCREADGTDGKIFMGCYGIGSSRLMGAVVECLHDERGMVWPIGIAPYQIHLVSLVREDIDRDRVDRLFRLLTQNSYEVLYDDRRKPTAGAKLADADLIGLPFRFIASSRTLAQDLIEVQLRNEETSQLVPIDILVNWCYQNIILTLFRGNGNG